MSRLKSATFALVALTAFGGAQAGPVTPVSLSYTNGALYNTAEIPNHVQTSAQMAGAQVTACFGSGSACQTLIWSATTGAVDGGDWSLGVSPITGDTNITAFVLEFSSSTERPNLSSLSIDGKLGLTAFDVVADPLNVNGSPGSQDGKPFTLTEDPNGLGIDIRGINVAYTDRLYVGGDLYNDLYSVMTITFDRPGGFGSGRMSFLTDTDRTSTIAAFVPEGTVPTPGTLALVGLALLGLASQTRRNAQR